MGTKEKSRIGFNKKSGSTSQWENSFFGGASKILYDHPYIEVPPTIEIDFKSPPEGLFRYTSEKLVKILLLHCNKFGFNIFDGGGIEEKEPTALEKLMGKKESTRYYVAHTTTKEKIVNQFATDRTLELSPLFEEFQFFLVHDVTIKCKLEDKNNNSEEEDGNGDGDEKKKAPKPTMSPLALAKAQQRKVKEHTPFKFNAQGSGNSVGVDAYKVEQWKVEADKVPYMSLTLDESLNSKKLLDMLDINFNPEKDVVKNLRLGKLDSSKIAQVESGQVHIYSRVEENQTTRPFSICMLGDESGSMRSYGVTYQRSLLKVLFATFSELLPPEKIFVYGHTANTISGGHYGDHDRNGVLNFRIYNEPYYTKFESTIEQMGRTLPMGNNLDGPAIKTVHERVRQFTSDDIIFINISDGAPAGELLHGESYGGAPAMDELKKICEMLRRDRFVTAGIGFGPSAKHVEKIYHYNKVITDFSLLARHVSSLLNKIVKTEFQ